MNNGNTRGITLGIIVGNRGFFPDHLAKSGREEMIAAVEKAGYGVVALGPEDSKCGAVTTRGRSGALRGSVPQEPRHTIDGIVVTLPNFGEERAIADTLRQSGLNVPVLIQAHPRYARPHDHSGPARQFLRQDVGVQQPEAVRDSVFPSPRATRKRRIRNASRRICAGSGPPAGWCAVCAACRIGAIGARPGGVQHRAL